MAGVDKVKTKYLKEFGAHLESLIYKKFKNKGEFLAKSGIYKATLHDITTGKSDPQLTTLKMLSDELGIPIKELFPPE
jgi:transcriptional regulator with XRE-family HTH domain